MLVRSHCMMNVGHICQAYGKHMTLVLSIIDHALARFQTINVKEVKTSPYILYHFVILASGNHKSRVI